AFADAVAQATTLAQQGKLVTFGIQPNAPETGYGYIEAEGNEVRRFVEKPSQEIAVEYVASGRFLWNSGMFLFQAGAMLKAMEQHCPDILSATQRCLDASRKAEGKDLVELELDATCFAQVPDNSIDYAVMERSA